MTKISEATTELLASGVTDPNYVKIAVADVQSTATGKFMTLKQLHKTISIIYSQTVVPSSGSAPGLYSVQTGTYKGLYVSGGVGAPVLVVAYSVDQDWPVV